MPIKVSKNKAWVEGGMDFASDDLIWCMDLFPENRSVSLNKKELKIILIFGSRVFEEQPVN